MEIIATRTAEAFASVQPAWDVLLEQCDTATIFQSWEWNDAWWQSFGHDKRLLLLQVRDHGTLIGLAPFCINRYPGTPLRRLTFVGTGASDYLDILAVPERAPEVRQSILQYLAAFRGHDLVDLQDLRPAALLRESVASHAPAVWAGPELSLTAQEPCPHVPLPSTWEEYFNRLSKNTRHHLPRCRRAFGRAFERAEIRLAGREETAAAMTALFELHRRRWQTQQQSGHLARQDVQAFHRRVAERFMARGWLRLYVACADDVMVGVEYAFCFHQRYYFYLNGFDPAFARYSLGSLLMLDAIRQAISEGCLEVDFLRGDEAYKAQLGALSERVNYRLRLWRPHSLRSQALLCLERLPGRLAPLVKLKRQLAETIHRTGVHVPSVSLKEREG